MTERTVAIYGGSFDPPHLGHVLSVAWALSASPVDAVWVIPTWQHAFDKDHGAPFDARLAMCERAFSIFAGVRVVDVERRLGGVSHTLRTLETLAAESPNTRFRLLIGADVLPDTDRWHRWDEVVQRAPPLVVGRDGYVPPEKTPISIPDVNSTDLRARLAKGQEVEGLIPSAVLDYIQTNQLYQGSE